MSKQYQIKDFLKPGELSAIQKHFTTKRNSGGALYGVMEGNCIVLSTTPLVTLKTNGAVIYGTFNEGDIRIKFTHDYMRYKEPYVAASEYVYYKQEILKAWREAYTEHAQLKMAAVKAVIDNELAKAQKKEAEAKNKAQKEQTPVVENKVETTTNTKKEEVKKEVKSNNKQTTKTVDKKAVKKVSKIDTTVNVMSLAHTIRRELGLEGHYQAQMKLALSLAWEVKKGLTTIEAVLGTAVVENVAENVAVENVADAVEATKADIVNRAKKVVKLMADKLGAELSDESMEYLLGRAEKEAVDQFNYFRSVDKDNTPLDQVAGKIATAIKAAVRCEITCHLNTLAEAEEAKAEEMKLAEEAKLAAGATHTYEAAENKEQAGQEPVAVKETVIKETVEKAVAQDVSYRVVLAPIVRGTAKFLLNGSDGSSQTCFEFKRTLNSNAADKHFSKQLANFITNGCPNNTVIEFYGASGYTELTFKNNPALMALAESKNIVLTQGVVPSAV